MARDMIAVLNLGSRENERLLKEIQSLGVDSALYPHSITAEELDAARAYCAQALRLVPDDPVELMMYYMRMNVTGAEISPEELAAACEGVTAEEVAFIARGCEFDTIYFLSGEDVEGEEADEA